MKKIVTFGELMLRLNPPTFDRFGQCSHFEAYFGGSEANVAVSLANYGLRSEFVSCLPAAGDRLGKGQQQRKQFL